jgi:hypothetical protein
VGSAIEKVNGDWAKAKKTMESIMGGVKKGAKERK